MVQKDKQVSGEEAEGIRIPVSAQTCEEKGTCRTNCHLKSGGKIMAEINLAGVETAGARNLQEPLTGHFDKLMLGKVTSLRDSVLEENLALSSKSSTQKKSPTKFSC